METAASSLVNAMFIKCRRRIDHHLGSDAGQCARQRTTVRCIASAGPMRGGAGPDDCFGCSLRYPKSRRHRLRPVDPKVKTLFPSHRRASGDNPYRRVLPTARHFGTPLKGPVGGARHYLAKIVYSTAPARIAHGLVDEYGHIRVHRHRRFRGGIFIVIVVTIAHLRRTSP
jgi:hypothetical protein